MRNKEKEILAAIAPENKQVNAKKRRRTRRRFGLASYYSPDVLSPFTVKYPK